MSAITAIPPSPGLLPPMVSQGGLYFRRPHLAFQTTCAPKVSWLDETTGSSIPEHLAVRLWPNTKYQIPNTASSGRTLRAHFNQPYTTFWDGLLISNPQTTTSCGRALIQAPKN